MSKYVSPVTTPDGKKQGRFGKSAPSKANLYLWGKESIPTGTMKDAPRSGRRPDSSYISHVITHVMTLMHPNACHYPFFNGIWTEIRKHHWASRGRRSRVRKASRREQACESLPPLVDVRGIRQFTIRPSPTIVFASDRLDLPPRPVVFGQESTKFAMSSRSSWGA